MVAAAGLSLLAERPPVQSRDALAG
jgi:hypothetical protein